VKSLRSSVMLLLDQHTPSILLIPAIESCGYLCEKTQWTQLHGIARHSPGILLIAQLEIQQPQLRDIIKHTESANHAVVVMLERAHDSVIHSLVDAETSLLHVGLLPYERMSFLLKLAVARHELRLRRQQQVKELQVQMQDMKLVSRAKGKLMHQQGITETRAHATMQKLAMARGQTLGELAQAILAS